MFRIKSLGEVIIIRNSRQKPNKVASCRQINLRPAVSKLFQNDLLKFGFRNDDPTVDQVHRISDILEKSLDFTDDTGNTNYLSTEKLQWMKLILESRNEV